LELNKNWFNHSETLKRLTFYENIIPKFPGAQFTNLRSLKFLSLSYNDIEEIAEDAFEGLYNLEVLNIAANLIEFLPKDIFKNLSSLQYLYMYQNQALKVVSGMLFRDLINLRILKFYDTSITELPDGIFQNNRKLEEIHMKGTNISKMPRKTFSGLRQLTYISAQNMACAPLYTLDHNFSIPYTEDVIIKCYCEPLKETDPLKFRKLTILLGTLFCIIILGLILLARNNGTNFGDIFKCGTFYKI
jgi:Leucine-rich repeat (LRR) protein